MDFIREGCCFKAAGAIPKAGSPPRGRGLKRLTCILQNKTSLLCLPPGATDAKSVIAAAIQKGGLRSVVATRAEPQALVMSSCCS